ncbi:MAG TPA: carboxypeptidase regulatory-like domain-containing protein, partial [Gemmatimonadales bacterium]|nr:carboxypeptidase regulatory-like domain-containing protein [Gemmatimonadales bacterium]
MPFRARRSIPHFAVVLMGAGAASTAAGPLSAQADTSQVMISGKVVDPEQRPLEGVDVRLVGDSTHRTTSAAGTFRFYASRGVEHLLQLRRIGYNAQLLKVTGDWSGTVRMVPGAFVLPEIMVNGHNAKPAEYAYTNKYDDFFRRKRQGIGEYIMRDEIEKRLAFQTTEIFEGRPGIRVNIQRDKGLASVAFARCNEYPPKINVYVDGIKMVPSNLAAIMRAGSESAIVGIAKPRDPEIAGIVGEMLTRVNPRDIEAVEIFR